MINRICIALAIAAVVIGVMFVTVFNSPPEWGAWIIATAIVVVFVAGLGTVLTWKPRGDMQKKSDSP
jgi:protein-S-isoprenylcysteine O-methyltransferase Ste14